MSCDCNRRYAGNSSGSTNVLQNVPPTGDAGAGTPGGGNEGMIFPGGFCWKCFAFWAVVALAVILLLRDERE